MASLAAWLLQAFDDGVAAVSVLAAATAEGWA